MKDSIIDEGYKTNMDDIFVYYSGVQKPILRLKFKHILSNDIRFYDC